MSFGEPLKWVPSNKFKRRPMVASLLKKAQEAEEQGRDGDEAIQQEMKPFLDQAREELGKKTPQKAETKKKAGYTPGFVNAKGEHVGVTIDSSGTTGAQKTYVEYFQARARARELMVAKKATDPEREKMRSERAKILKRAQGLVERLKNPPKIELSESLGEPADLDLNDPEQGSDDPRGWWRLPPAGEDRDRAIQAHKNAVEAHENRDKWFYASVPEDASTVGIDIRKAGQPNVPWPFPSKHLKNVPGPEPMDPDTASLYWWNWARKGLDDDIDKRTEKLLEHAEKQARELDLSEEGMEAAVVTARCKVVLAVNASKNTLREHSEALLERVRLGPAGRLLQARDHVKKRREHVDQLAEQYKLYLLGQKLLGKKAGPSPWAEKKDVTDTLRERYLIQLQAWWRGQGYRRRTFREKRDRRVVNALATLVAELGGDASGVAAAASGLSDVFSQRKKAAPPPRVPPSAARVSRATSAVRFSSDEAPPLSRPPSVASSRRPSADAVPEAAPPSPSPRPSVAEVADEPPASQESSARPTPRQQLFVAETPAVVQERSAKVRAAEASAAASERRRNATGAKRLADPSATGPPRL